MCIPLKIGFQMLFGSVCVRSFIVFTALPFAVLFYIEPRRTLLTLSMCHLHPLNAQFHEIMVAKTPFCKTPP